MTLLKKWVPLVLIPALFLAGCGNSSSESVTSQSGSSAAAAEAAGSLSSSGEETVAADSASQDVAASSEDESVPEIEGLSFESVTATEYAEGFTIYNYSGGYKYIRIPESGNYLVVPEGGETPENLPDDTTVIRQPLDNVYLAATSVMSLVDAIGAIDQVTMTGTEKDGWYIDCAIEAYESGKLQYAGKYSLPDYEMLVDNNCDLAIESTMIFHAPEVQEMLQDLGIPVFIDRASYELTVFGRIEWVKVYGALFDKEKEADAFFNEQKKILDQAEDYEDTGKTVAFFSVNEDGTIVVRKTEDIIPNMIKLAGGQYIFKDLENSKGDSASVQLSMEKFYADAADADYLVYNATIEDPLESTEDLVEKDELFSDFKAVKENNVWQVDRKWYQSTATVGNLIVDFHIMLTDGDQSRLSFLSKVEG